MKNRMRFLGLFLATLVLLPGCMRMPSYKRRSLQSISNNCMYRGSEKSVIIHVKKLSHAEKNYIFDARMHDNDLQVIYFSIHNLSDEAYMFPHDGIHFELVPHKNVMKLLKKTSAIIISSGEQYEGIVLVKSLDYTPEFTVTMHEKDNVAHTVTFDVDLRQIEQQE